MKVLFIARKFPPSVGGMERFAFDLSTALADETDLVKITWSGSNKWLPVVLPAFFFRACWVLATKKIDVIHIQDGVQAPLGWLLHSIFGQPYVVVAHGLDITFTKGFYQQLILPFIRKASAVISISSATKEEVDKRGVKKQKSFVITLGTHDDYGSIAPDRNTLAKHVGLRLADRKLLLTTGRLVKRKGVAWFIDAVMPNLVAKDPSILYLVAGEGSQRSEIEERIRAHDLGDHVTLLGRVNDEDRLLLYTSCDVFVMPNIVVSGDMEGFGIVAHEAATAGLPVVASGLEGILDALQDGENGILVTMRDAADFEEKITQLLSDEKRRHAFGLRAREYTLTAFSWTTIARRYIAVYKKLLA